jgi:site-specific DNA-methyltransferase (adenine-specific)
MVLGHPQLAEPGSCCTETFIVLGPLRSRKQAESLASYMRTRFFRFLVSLRKVSQDAPKGTYLWVPLQTWDREWTDDDLFEKYDFGEDERRYVTEMIKEMPV